MYTFHMYVVEFVVEITNIYMIMFNILCILIYDLNYAHLCIYIFCSTKLTYMVMCVLTFSDASTPDCISLHVIKFLKCFSIHFLWVSSYPVNPHTPIRQHNFIYYAGNLDASSYRHLLPLSTPSNNSDYVFRIGIVEF